MREGGSYVMEKGKAKLVERTQPSSQGDAAREADGGAVDVTETPARETPTPERAAEGGKEKKS